MHHEIVGAETPAPPSPVSVNDSCFRSLSTLCYVTFFLKVQFRLQSELGRRATNKRRAGVCLFEKEVFFLLCVSPRPQPGKALGANSIALPKSRKDFRQRFRQHF